MHSYNMMNDNFFQTSTVYYLKIPDLFMLKQAILAQFLVKIEVKLVTFEMKLGIYSYRYLVSKWFDFGGQAPPLEISWYTPGAQSHDLLSNCIIGFTNGINTFGRHKHLTTYYSI
jgi:hypothetical protein